MRRESWIRTSFVLAVGLFAAAASAGAACPSTAVASLPARVVTAVRVGPFGQSPALAEVVFTMQPSADGGTLLVAEGPAVRAEKTVAADRLVLVLKAEADQVTIRVDGGGRIAATRGGKTRTLTAGAVSKTDLAAMRSLLDGSDAVAAFRLMAASLEERGGGAAVESTVISGALVSLLDGDVAAPGRLAQRIIARAAARVRLASGQRTSGECWDVYSREALRIADETEECLKRQWWNPLHTAACGAEFVIRAELNWFWLIACSGGFPG
jgi:hypothetical protein